MLGYSGPEPVYNHELSVKEHDRIHGNCSCGQCTQGVGIIVTTKPQMHGVRLRRAMTSTLQGSWNLMLVTGVQSVWELLVFPLGGL